MDFQITNRSEKRVIKKKEVKKNERIGPFSAIALVIVIHYKKIPLLFSYLCQHNISIIDDG